MKRAFEDAPLCEKCGQVQPTGEARFAARVNKKTAYWRHLHLHDLARLTRETVPAEEIGAALRARNQQEIDAEEFPAHAVSSPLPSPDGHLYPLRYTLDIKELHHRHSGDLIDILEANIAAAKDPGARRTQIENKLQQILKARSEDRHKMRAMRAHVASEKQ